MRRATGPPFEIVPFGNQSNKDDFEQFLYQSAPPALFLDAKLQIMLFTPAMTGLLNILGSDVGRPLADLSAEGLGADVLMDALAVLAEGGERTREVSGTNARVFRRQVAPYVPPGPSLPGISITFHDVTDLKRLANDLLNARQEIEAVSFHHLDLLSALSYELRQPMQTLKLLQGLLSETLNDASAHRLADYIGDTLTSMSSTINLLLEKTPSGADVVRGFHVHPLIALEPSDSLSNALLGSLEAKICGSRHSGLILIVEDEGDLLKLLGSLLHHEGYEVAMAQNSHAALSWIAHSGLKPDLVLTDYHLGDDITGLRLVNTIRTQLRTEVPAIVLTGDVSRQTAMDVSDANCTKLNKPTRLKELIQRVHSMFAVRESELLLQREIPGVNTLVYIVDNDALLRETVKQILQAETYQVLDFATCEEFLLAYSPKQQACLLLDALLPGTSGIAMLREMRLNGDMLPTIIISAAKDISIAVEAMKAGAWDFIEKPFDRNEMLDSINRALGRSLQTHRLTANRQEAIDYIAALTARQRQIMDMVLAGHPSKNIAVDLGISQRTVENHRASIMTRTHSRSIPALARLALAANLQSVEDDPSNH